MALSGSTAAKIRYAVRPCMALERLSVLRNGMIAYRGGWRFALKVQKGAMRPILPEFCSSPNQR
jgi:hypothetical protein